MDIEGEMLTPLEYNDVVRRFYSQHPFMDFTSNSCTACGIRHIERTKDPYISYIDVPLTEPNIIEGLQYSPQQALDLTRQRDAPESIVTIPFDANWNQRTINLTSAIPFFESSHDGAPVFWHLHPELVGSMPDGERCATLCPICHESVMRNKTIPRLSIAAGVDFGYFQRLGLVYPNLHEQMILSRTRLYFTVIKVSSNLKGQVNMNHRNKARCHSIMFPHNASEIASNMFGSSLRGEGGLLQLEELQKLLHLYMVDPQGRPDAIAKDIFQTVNLLARPHVVAQWLIVLKWLNPHYADLDLFDLKRTVVDSLELLNKEIIDQCHTINDPDVLEYEMALGSDVAGVRNTEILGPGAGVQRCHDVDPAGVEFNDISYSYVTNSEAAYYSGGTEDFCLKALEAFADYYSGDCAEDPTGDDTCDFNEDDIRDYLQRNPLTGRNVTARGSVPFHEFDKDDKNLSTSFPQVFLLGTAYGREPGRLSCDQRSHLLNQFHMVPAKDRRLLGFLFDVKQRFQVMDGVKAHVEGSRGSIIQITKLIKQPAERAKLKHAINNPNTSSAKQLLNKYLKHLLFSCKDVSYGVLEGSKLKQRLLAATYRYSAPTCFLTISPGTIH
jgi:hypothetical protein